ncbi:MAG: hypothetical protein HOP08_06495 [Cyclobacteriaceae bacterium]|nr:hypothetical protein [Cyclobacteriaceae bacterium]
MKRGGILLGVGFFLITISGFSQDYTFKVLANKGANEYKSADGWQALKTGASLKSGDELKISENAYLGLVHINGKPLEVKQAGNYKVADLAAKVGTGTSVVNKYTDFILSSNSAEAKKNRLSATGAVHRGTPGQLNLLLPADPTSAYVFGKSMVIEWTDQKIAGPYIVTLENIFEEELIKIETPEKMVRIDLSDPKFANETALMVVVVSKKDPAVKSGDKKVVKKISVAEGERIKKSFAEIAGDVKDESAFSKFIQAGFFEQNKLLIDALTSYDDAIRLAPDVEDFKIGKEEFLIRNNMVPVKK